MTIVAFMDFKESAPDLAEVEEEFDNVWDWKSKFALSFILFGVLGLAVMVLHRDSRPREMFTFFGVFDDHLKGLQDRVDGIVEKGANAKDILMSGDMFKHDAKPKMSKEDDKLRRIDEQFQIDLIEITLGSKSDLFGKKIEHKIETEDDGVEFWRKMNDKVVAGNKALKEQQKALEVELEEVKGARRAYYNETDNGNGSIKAVNDKIKEQVGKMKQSNYNEELIDFDTIFEEIYRNLFNSTILNSLIDDAKSRTENLSNAVKHIAGKPGTTEMKENKCLNPTGKDRDFVTNHVWEGYQEFVARVLKGVKKWSSDDTDRFGDFKFHSPVLRKLVESDFRVNFPSRWEHLITLEYQKIDSELFRLTLKDINYHSRLVNAYSLADSTQKFMNELSIVTVTKAQETKLDALKGRLRSYNKNQTIRISNLKKKTNSRLQEDLATLWHKRKLLELFTKWDIIRNYHINPLHLKLVHDLTANFNTWITKVLLVKERSLTTFSNIFGEKLGVGDHQNYSFKLDRVLKDFQKYVQKHGTPAVISSATYKNIYDEKSYLIFPDGMLFSTALIYGQIAKLSPENKLLMVEKWPATEETDEPFLGNTLGDLYELNMVPSIALVNSGVVTPKLADKIVKSIDKILGLENYYDHSNPFSPN